MLTPFARKCTGFLCQFLVQRLEEISRNAFFSPTFWVNLYLWHPGAGVLKRMKKKDSEQLSLYKILGAFQFNEGNFPNFENLCIWSILETVSWIEKCSFFCEKRSYFVFLFYKMRTIYIVYSIAFHNHTFSKPHNINNLLIN